MPYFGSQPSASLATTASLGDDIVTLAKMAGGTDGQIITYDASGNPSAVGPGSDGQVLTSTGAGSPPAFEAAGGGSWNFIGTSVASDSASLTITGLSSTYDVYAVHLTDLLPATDDVDLYIRLGDSSGVDSGGSDYTYTGIGCESSSPGADPEGSDGATFILATIYANGVGSGTGEGAGCTFFLTGPGDGTMRSTVHGQTSFLTTNTTLRACWFSGNRNAVITHDRVNVLFSSGNITSGRMTVWGIAHS